MNRWIIHIDFSDLTRSQNSAVLEKLGIVEQDEIDGNLISEDYLMSLINAKERWSQSGSWHPKPILTLLYCLIDTPKRTVHPQVVWQRSKYDSCWRSLIWRFTGCLMPPSVILLDLYIFARKLATLTCRTAAYTYVAQMHQTWFKWYAGRVLKILVEICLETSILKLLKDF